MNSLTVPCPIPHLLLSVYVSHINMNKHCVVHSCWSCVLLLPSVLVYTLLNNKYVGSWTNHLISIMEGREVVEMISVILSSLERGCGFISTNKVRGFAQSLGVTACFCLFVCLFNPELAFLSSLLAWFYDLRNFHLWALLLSYPEARPSLLQFLWCPTVQILLWCIVTES